MSELARSEPRRTELESSRLPEVAALASALATLFNALGVPQQQYAVRTNMDKSTVSRYLGGKRIATQEFIDRLIFEVERHRGTQMQDEARTRMRDLRLTALRICDPAAYELENLRAQLEASQRDIKRLVRQHEALELLLDQREKDANEANQKYLELQGDWIVDRTRGEASLFRIESERSRLDDECGRLRIEIAELRRQLGEIEHLKDRAEENCQDLQSRLDYAERALAERLEKESMEATGLSIDELKDELVRCRQEDRFYDVARELSDAAARLPIDDLVELTGWLSRRGEALNAARLLDDGFRFRSFTSARELAEKALSARILDRGAVRTMASSIANSRPKAEIVDLYLSWHGQPDTGRLIFDVMLAWVWLEEPPQIIEALKIVEGHRDSRLHTALLFELGAQEARRVVAFADGAIDRNREDDARTLIHRRVATIVDKLSLAESLAAFNEASLLSPHADFLLELAVSRLSHEVVAASLAQYSKPGVAEMIARRLAQSNCAGHIAKSIMKLSLDPSRHDNSRVLFRILKGKPY